MKTVLIHILLITATTTFDAWSTNRYQRVLADQGRTFVEYNPLGRPFVGKPSLYFAAPAAQVTIYVVLRKKDRKLAHTYAYAASGAHVLAGLHNVRGANCARSWAETRLEEASDGRMDGIRFEETGAAHGGRRD